MGGRVADRVGRRRAFLTGLAGFAARLRLRRAWPRLSAALVAGRAAPGRVRRAAHPDRPLPVAVTFTDGRERAKAFGVYGAVASSGAAVVGLLLGGVLTEYAGWRCCLFVNVGIALAARSVAGRCCRPTPAIRPARWTPPPACSSRPGWRGLVLGCARAAGHGWASLAVLAPGARWRPAPSAAFLVRQRLSQPRSSRCGLLADRSGPVPTSRWRSPSSGSFGMFLMLTYHFQEVLGWTRCGPGWRSSRCRSRCR